MKFLLLLLSILIISCDDIGKDYKWDAGKGPPGFTRRFGKVGYDYGWNASYSPIDEGTIIVGQTSSEIFGESDMWAIKVDNRGITQWEKSFGGSLNDAGYDAIATLDGGFLFVGYTWSRGNEQQIFVVKTDFQGNTEWEKTFGGSVWDVGNAVIELYEGGYLIAGYSNSPGISSGNTDMYLIKINNDGEQIWQKAYGNQAFPNHEWANDIIQLDDGGFIVVGARDRYEKGSLNALIIRLDKSGDLIWEKELTDENEIYSESIYSISQSPTGLYYLCSTLNSSSDPLIYQPKIIKIDSSGNIDWQRVFFSDGREFHQYRATVTYKGNIVLVGTSGQQMATGYKYDAFMTKINSLGDIIWNYRYGSPDEDDWGWSVFETPKNNLVLVGSTKSFGASLFDVFLVGTNQNGISQ